MLDMFLKIDTLFTMFDYLLTAVLRQEGPGLNSPPVVSFQFCLELTCMGSLWVLQLPPTPPVCLCITLTGDLSNVYLSLYLLAAGDGHQHQPSPQMLKHSSSIRHLS